jgi:predicted  nucleic acid-binding Zn-ribbon protein
MDTAAETIARLEKEMENFETRATVSRTSIEGLTAQMEATAAELEERRAALAEVSKATEEQELQFAHKREKILVHIAKPDLAVYHRIRKARKGKAVVPVTRNACGGCFARVPPQKILELRRNDRIFTCEHCGRILVSDEIVEAVAKEQ